MNKVRKKRIYDCHEGRRDLRIWVRCTEEEYDYIDSHAKDSAISRSNFVMECVKQFKEREAKCALKKSTKKGS